MGKRLSQRVGAVESGVRQLRLEHLLAEELNSLFDSEVTDEELSGVRVTRVELSRDGSRARVWFITDEPAQSLESVLHALQRATSFLRRRLTDALPLKRSPELRFSPSPLGNEASPDGERTT